MIVVVYFLYRVIIRQDALVQNQKEIIKSIEKLESNEIKTYFYNKNEYKI